MPARKLRNGEWIVDVWIEIPGQGRTRLRKRSPIQTKKGALEYEALLVADALSPSARRERRTFEKYAVEFLENHVRPTCKYSTLVSYEYALGFYLVPYFEGRELATVGPADVAKLQGQIHARGCSSKTVRNILAVLSSALCKARDWGYLEEVPRIVLPKPGPTRFRFLSIEECQKLEEHATPYWREMIVFARKTGLRLGELCALTWEQVNLAQGTVLVDRAVWRGKVALPKHNKIRSVDLSPETVKMLGRETRRTGLVFPGRSGGMRLDQKCDVGLRRCARRAGLEPFGWHVLRHTYASHLVAAGAPIPVVQALLGHTDIRLTMRYAHLSPGHTTRAAALLDSDRVGQQLGISPNCPQPETDRTHEKN